MEVNYNYRYTNMFSVCRFTQPETLLCVVAVVLIYFASHLDAESISDVLLRFVHITSFSLFVGMSFWVTFIAGK